MCLKADPLDPEWEHPLRYAERAQFAELQACWDERFQKELLKKDTELVSMHKKLDNKSNYKRRDLSLLLGTDSNEPVSGWISDETVNEYMSWICRFGNTQAQRVRSSTGKRGVTERFVTINSLAVASLFDITSPLYKGPEGMTRILKRLNCEGELLLRPEFIFLPIQKHESHWILGVIIPGQRMIAVLDSLTYNENMEVAVIIDNMIRHELGNRYDHRDNGELYKNPDWVLYDRTGPAQNNGSDCGVHMLTNAMCMIMGWGMTYEAKDIPAKRRRIAAELMSGFEGDGGLSPVSYLQCNGNSIAPGTSNPKYPLARGDTASDAEIEHQNQRTNGYDFINENSKSIKRDDVRLVPQPVKLPESVFRPTERGAFQDLPIFIDSDAENGSLTPVDTGLSVPPGQDYQGFSISNDVFKLPSEGNAQTQPPSKDSQALRKRLRADLDSQLQNERMPQGSVTNPPNLLRHMMQPTPYRSREDLVAAVDLCDHKRALKEVCRAHGWVISEYYAWGALGVSLENYKAKVKEEDATIRSEVSLF